MVYIHADESDWPYLLSHNALASDCSLSDHLEDVWGPGGITQSNAPLGMHTSLHRVLEMWHLFFQVLTDLCLGENMPFELLHEQFLEAIKDNLSMVRLHGNIVPKPANPQWQNNAFTLWAQCLQGGGRNIIGSVIYTWPVYCIYFLIYYLTFNSMDIHDHEDIEYLLIDFDISLFILGYLSYLSYFVGMQMTLVHLKHTMAHKRPVLFCYV